MYCTIVKYSLAQWVSVGVVGVGWGGGTRDLEEWVVGGCRFWQGAKLMHRLELNGVYCLLRKQLLVQWVYASVVLKGLSQEGNVRGLVVVAGAGGGGGAGRLLYSHSFAIPIHTRMYAHTTGRPTALHLIPCRVTSSRSCWCACQALLVVSGGVVWGLGLRRGRCFAVLC